MSNTDKTDKGNTTDKSFQRAIRDAKSRLYGEHPIPLEFHQFVDVDIAPTLTPPPRKVEVWRNTLRHCIHNVVTASLVGQCIADARNRNTMPPLRIACWSALTQAGWVRMAVGSQLSKKVTRYIASARLLDRRKLWTLRMLDGDMGNTSTAPDLILLTTGKTHWLTGEPIPPHERGHVSIRERVELTAQRDPEDIRRADPEAVCNGLAYFTEIEDIISTINANNSDHSWKAFRTIEGVNGKPRRVAFQPSVELKQIHSQRLFRAARLYTMSVVGAQSMSEEQRAEMLIDGKPIVEPDFSCLHIRMLYHFIGQDPKGDLYRSELVFPTLHRSKATPQLRKAVRGFLKEATAAVLNTSSRNEALGAVHGMVDACPRAVRNVLFQLENSGPNDLLTRIENVHPDLMERGKFYSDAANQLMQVDGTMMLHMLKRFADAGKPALGVHDSLVVKAEDERFARRVMTDVYVTFFPGHRPVIK